ncbi:MAG: aspartate aminotransferase family protein [Candidatus Eisenbacteria bacterium]|nr:aspartate aminotransferase family protein [Candidatus Latescibacterota bacterium]MBD3302781.1 aspartate aminotransferase family protein [Candidatus Eisenbacteria bacterium]
MTPDEFRRRGRQVVDWIADYYERIERFPVLSRAKPGEIRAMLPPDPPETGEEFDTVLADLDRVILPGITHWQAPGFFAYFPANASGPSILGELLSAGLGVQGMLWSTSPACTELETHLMDWLVGMLGLPERFRSDRSGGGVIQDTASSAALCALHTAREGARAAGRDGPLVAYASTQAHSSIEKGIRIAGIGEESLRLVEVDDRLALRADALAEAVAEDRRAGRVPFFVCATVGTTSSHAIDPLAAIGPICRREDLWLHVDAAMAGTAALCPELRWILEGCEHADSFCFNPHKWMFTNFDCDCFWVADRKSLIDALSILPEYLRNKATESGAVIDYRDWHVPLGRRFRALKLWFVIRHYGVEGLRREVRENVRIAQELAGKIEEDPRFELVVPPPLNLVCFRLIGDDAANQRLLDTLNESGEMFLTATRLDDRLVLRMSIGGTNTRAVHVERAWERIVAEAAKIA